MGVRRLLGGRGTDRGFGRAVPASPAGAIGRTTALGNTALVSAGLTAGAIGLGVLQQPYLAVVVLSAGGAAVTTARVVRRRALAGADQMARTAARVRASERARCSRLLHDHTLQVLETLNACDQIKDPLVRAQLADETVWLRRLVEVGLDPGYVALIDELRLVVRRFRRRGLNFHLVARPASAAVVLPGAVVEAFEGAVTEALNNVWKHAGASVATVTVSVGRSAVVVVVVDDGCGFRTDEVSAGCMGVRHSLHSWLASVGGSATVSTTVGQGTEVRLRYPFTGSRAVADRE
jgi:signal transduction histidine kinase